MKTNKKIWLYLDDVRTPKDDNWQVVRNYDEFIAHIKMNGLDNYEIISLDHDLGDTAMNEYFNNVSPNYTLDYNNIQEKTGLHCAKWLVNEFYNVNPKWSKLARDVKKGKPFPFPKVYVHSANPIGSANMMGYINNFFMNEAQAQTCVRVNIEHTI
jgi:hypothetical protein